MIRHVFLWKVTDDGDPAYVLSRLNELPTRIGGCLSWTTGPHRGEEGISGGVWEFALVADYASMDDLEAYTNDPFHVEVVDELLPFFADRAVCDFEISDVEEALS